MHLQNALENCDRESRFWGGEKLQNLIHTESIEAREEGTIFLFSYHPFVPILFFRTKGKHIHYKRHLILGGLYQELYDTAVLESMCTAKDKNKSHIGVSGPLPPWGTFRNQWLRLICLFTYIAIWKTGRKESGRWLNREILSVLPCLVHPLYEQDEGCGIRSLFFGPYFRGPLGDSLFFAHFRFLVVFLVA